MFLGGPRMSHAYETAHEMPETGASSQFDRGALDARLKRAQPLEVGAPDQMLDTPLRRQGDQPDCLLRSAQMAEEKQTGRNPGLDAYKRPAIEQGIYDPGGGVTDLNQFVDVINERPGVQAELSQANGPENVKDALDDGKSVIACVDAYDLYKGMGNFEPTHGGHTVVVTGADQAPDGSWQFAINDPNADMRNVPVDGSRFLPAWDAMHRPMITVEKA